MVPSSSQANQAKSAFVAPAVAGLVSGWIGVVIGHPLDTMKTRIQTNRPLLVLSLSELYRGIAPPLLTVGFVQAANFSLLEGGKVRRGQHYSALLPAPRAPTRSPTRARPL